MQTWDVGRFHEYFHELYAMAGVFEVEFILNRPKRVQYLIVIGHVCWENDSK